MDATITIQELLVMILYLLGIGLLGFLVALIKNINSTVSKAKKIVERNEEEIDESLKQLPGIFENVNSITENVDAITENTASITEETKDLIKIASPEIEGIVSNANSMSEKAEHTTEKLANSIDLVTESALDTAFVIEDNLKNLSGYGQLILEIIEIIKNVIKNK